MNTCRCGALKDATQDLCDACRWSDYSKMLTVKVDVLELVMKYGIPKLRKVIEELEQADWSRQI